MSASKFALYGTALFRAPRTLHRSPSFHFSKPFPPRPLRFHRCVSSAVVDTVTADDTGIVSSGDQQLHHPWPEWTSFVDHLRSKGYLTEAWPPPPPPPSSSVAEGRDGIDDSTGGDSVYRNINLLKDGCLSFGRDRYDVFKLLSMKDIQAVVEGGCPNIFRKTVNSAKRLRAHLRLDEGDVCSACNLRGSCDRAYVILKEPEAAARTVDIARILLFHALDPLVISGGEKPPGREIIESSARKLLTELIEYSESSPAPAPPKPITKDSQPKEKSLDLFFDDNRFKDVDMKRGDWMCPKCNFMNFSRNMQCLKCNEAKPKNTSPPDVEMKKGDWICPECSFMNFSRNIQCLKCKAQGPKKVNTDDVTMKKGDWNCPRCGFMNFASNRKCLRCPEQRPARQLNPGDWECPKCDFLNYKRNTACLKCNTARPEERGSADDEDDLWKSPA